MKKRRMRFRLRTLLVAVAVVATLCAVGPPLWRRWQLSAGVEAAVEREPGFSWQFDPITATRADNERVLNRYAENFFRDGKARRKWARERDR